MQQLRGSGLGYGDVRPEAYARCALAQDGLAQLLVMHHDLSLWATRACPSYDSLLFGNVLLLGDGD